MDVIGTRLNAHSQKQIQCAFKFVQCGQAFTRGLIMRLPHKSNIKHQVSRCDEGDGELHER